MRRRISMMAVVGLLGAALTVATGGPAASAPGIIHVDVAASGANDGSSWSDAFTDLQDGLAAATAGDEIRVAQGTYRPHASDPTVAFEMIDGVDMIGGYATGGSSDPDPTRYLTVLSGDLRADDLPGGLNRADNSNEVVRFGSDIGSSVSTTAGAEVRTAPDASAELDGGPPQHEELAPRPAPERQAATADRAAAEATAPAVTLAGVTVAAGDVGIDLDRAVHVLLREIVAEGNDSDGLFLGGLGYPEGGPSDVTVENSAFRNNGRHGLRLLEISGVALRSVRAQSNGGAGVDTSQSAVAIEASVFADNGDAGVSVGSADNGAGGTDIRDSWVVSNRGGGLAGYNDAGFDIRDSFILSNSTSGSGGGILNDFSGMRLVRSIVANNSAGANGGGLYNHDTFTTIVGSTIVGNVAGGDGGGVHHNSDYEEHRIVGSVITGNHAAGSGGGLYLSGDSSEPRVSSSVVADNSADVSSGGIHNAMGSGFVDVALEVANSIVWGNGGPGLVDVATIPSVVNHSDVEGWTGAGTGNIDADPLFVGTGNYRLQAGSPARNAGDNASIGTSFGELDVFDLDGDGDTAEPTPDLDLRARIQGQVIDMGAYETPVPFDDFAFARVISGTSGTSTASTVGATAEVDEPAVDCGGGTAPTNSVWFSWTAPTTTRVQVDTLGSDFDTVLRVHEGSELGSLVQRACNDDVDGAGHQQAAVAINATAGSTYHFQVDGVGGETGSVQLSWAPVPTITAGGFVANPEGDSGTTTWELPVTLSSPATVPVTVDYAAYDIAANPLVAHPGVDYTLPNGSLVFAPGETSKTIAVEVIGDTIDEPPLLYGEWGLVQLSDPTFTRITGGLFGLGVFAIIDDDVITSDYSILTGPGAPVDGAVFAADASIPIPYLEYESGDVISDGGGTVTEGVGVDWYIDEVLFRNDDSNAPYDLAHHLSTLPVGVPFNGFGPIGEDNEFVLGPGTHTIRAEAFYPGGTKNFVATFTIES